MNIELAIKSCDLLTNWALAAETAGRKKELKPKYKNDKAIKIKTWFKRKKAEEVFLERFFDSGFKGGKDCRGRSSRQGYFDFD